jgi:hypothetical protein
MPLFRKIAPDEAREILMPELMLPYLDALREAQDGDLILATLSAEDLEQPRVYASRLGKATRLFGVKLTKYTSEKPNLIVYKVQRRNGEPTP